MQYNKGTRTEVLTGRRSAREEKSFGLSLGGGEGGGREKKAAKAQQIDNMKSALCV